MFFFWLFFSILLLLSGYYTWDWLYLGASSPFSERLPEFSSSRGDLQEKTDLSSSFSWGHLQEKARLAGLSLYWREEPDLVRASTSVHGFDVTLTLTVGERGSWLVRENKQEWHVVSICVDISIDTHGAIPRMIKEKATDVDTFERWKEPLCLLGREKVQDLFATKPILASIDVVEGCFLARSFMLEADLVLLPNAVIKMLDLVRFWSSELAEERLLPRLFRKVQEVPVTALMKHKESAHYFFLVLSFFPDNVQVKEIARSLLAAPFEPDLVIRERLMFALLAHLEGELLELAVQKALVDPVPSIRFAALKRQKENQVEAILAFFAEEDIPDELWVDGLSLLPEVASAEQALPLLKEALYKESVRVQSSALQAYLAFALKRIKKHRNYALYKVVCAKLNEHWHLFSSSVLRELASSWTWLLACGVSSSHREEAFLDASLQSFLLTYAPLSLLAKVLPPLAKINEEGTASFVVKVLEPEKKEEPNEAQIAAVTALGHCGRASEVKVLRSLLKNRFWSKRSWKASVRSAISRIQSRIKHGEKGGLSLVALGGEEGGLSLVEERGGLTLVGEQDVVSEELSEGD